MIFTKEWISKNVWDLLISFVLVVVSLITLLAGLEYFICYSVPWLICGLLLIWGLGYGLRS